MTRIVILATFLFACSKTGFIYIPEPEHKYSIDNSEYLGDTKETIKYYKGKRISAQGKIAINNYGEVSKLKVGKWLEYYDNTNLKSKGSYQIGKYIQCCTAGPCEQFYNYRIGHWEYWHSNGQLKAVVEYEAEEHFIDTSCEEGDSLLFGRAKRIIYSDENSNTIDPPKSLIDSLESVDYEVYRMKIHPDNNKQVIIRHNPENGV